MTILNWQLIPLLEKYKQLLYILQGSVIDANTCLTQEDAIKHITANVIYTPFNMDKETGLKKKREFAEDILNNDWYNTTLNNAIDDAEYYVCRNSCGVCK